MFFLTKYYKIKVSCLHQKTMKKQQYLNFIYFSQLIAQSNFVQNRNMLPFLVTQPLILGAFP